jgi:hypothetical protein
MFCLSSVTLNSNARDDSRLRTCSISIVDPSTWRSRRSSRPPRRRRAIGRGSGECPADTEKLPGAAASLDDVDLVVVASTHHATAARYVAPRVTSHIADPNPARCGGGVLVERRPSRLPRSARAVAAVARRDALVAHSFASGSRSSSASKEARTSPPHAQVRSADRLARARHPILQAPGHGDAARRAADQGYHREALPRHAQRRHPQVLGPRLLQQLRPVPVRSRTRNPLGSYGLHSHVTMLAWVGDSVHYASAIRSVACAGTRRQSTSLVSCTCYSSSSRSWSS